MNAASSSAGAVPTSGIPAPYGRACANCSRAKCRCIYRQDGSGCERCFRLKKECRPSTPVRRRATGKKSSSAMLSRTAQLEQKLDGLVSLLTAQTNNHLKEHEAVREGSAATTGTGTDTATDTAHSCGSDSAPSTHAQGTPAASTGTAHSDYAVESRVLPAVNSEFRPEFGRGMMPQAVPPLPARITTPLPRRSDTSMPDHGSTGLALGMSSMPRTPESSTSSVPAPGGRPFKRQNTQTQQQQPPPQQPPQNAQNTQNTQNAQTSQTQPQQTMSASTFGLGYSYFPNTPKVSRTMSADDSAPSSPDDPLNLDPELTPSPADAEHSYHVFRNTMLPFFPFVHLPESITAQQLRATRPYLWLAIMSMTYQRLPGHVQQARTTHLRALLAQRIVLEGEKNLDLLQSLLTLLTWIHYTAKRDRPTLSAMMQLAVSLVYDLGLHKFMAPCKSLIARLVRDHYQQSNSGGAAGADDLPDLPALSLDERRAALACCVLTSKFSHALKRCDTLKWTSRMEEHLSEVAAKAEGLLDHVLVAQVRLQRVADFVNQGEWQGGDLNPALTLSVDCMALGSDSAGGGMPGSNEDNSRRLMPSYVGQLVRAKIDEIKDSIPPDVRHCEAVLDAIYALEMAVCAAAVMPVIAPMLSMSTITAVAIRSMNTRGRFRQPQSQPRDLSQNQNQGHDPSHDPSQAQKQPNPTPVRPVMAADFVRIAALERCVESVATFWAFFQEITTGSFAALPFSYIGDFSLCIVLLYGLSVVDEPYWDRAAVRDRLHVLDMLDGFIGKLRDAPRIVPSAGLDTYDVFTRAATILGSVRELWAADLGISDSDREDADRERQRRAAMMSAPRPQTAAPMQPTTAPMPSTPMPQHSRPQHRAMAAEMNMAMPTDAPAWQMPPMPIMGSGDTAMGDAPQVPPQDPTLMLGPDGTVPDLFSGMGLSDDYMFWDLFLPGDNGAPQI